MNLSPARELAKSFARIGMQRMPMPLIHAMAEIKRAAAEVNHDLGLLDAAKAGAIAEAAARVAAGEFRANAQQALTVPAFCRVAGTVAPAAPAISVGGADVAAAR